MPIPRPPHQDAWASVDTPIAPGHVRRPAVAGLHQPVVVAGGEEEDRLAARRLHHLADVAHDQACGAPGSRGRRSPGGRTGCSRPRSSAPSRTARSRRPRSSAWTSSSPPAGLPARRRVAAPRALLQDRDRLVDPAQQRALALLEDLHQDLRVVAVLLEQRLGVVEVGVGVVAARGSSRPAAGRPRGPGECACRSPCRNATGTLHGYEISTDRARLDVAVVHRYLSEEAYWSPGVARAVVERAIANSLCFGLYAPGGGAGGLRARGHRPGYLGLPGRRLRARGAPRPRPGRVAGGDDPRPSGPAGAAAHRARDGGRPRPLRALRLRSRCAGWSGSWRSSRRRRRGAW